MRGQGSRLPGLDGLRGAAAIGVVVLHVWIYTGANDEGHSVLVDAVIGEFRIGLMAFFVISAFLLVRPWVSSARTGRPLPRVVPFMMRRVARVFPAYWLATAVAFVLLLGLGSGRSASLDQLPLFAVLAQFQVDETRKLLLPQAWSLAVEMSFYLLLPVIGWTIVRLAAGAGARLAAIALAAFLTFAGLAWGVAAESAGWPVTVTSSLPTFLPVFACGIAAAAVPADMPAAVRRCVLLLGAALVVCNGIWHSEGTGFIGHVVRDLPAGVGFGLMVATLAAGPAGFLERSPLRWIGVTSYGTYLWHMPVIYLLRAHDLLPQDPASAIGLVLVPSLVLGGLSWYGLERPILRWSEGLPLDGFRPSASSSGARA